jgi:hypothetical protein
MHFRGLVFSDHVLPMMNSLIHADGYGRQEVWLPLDTTSVASQGEPAARSGWAITKTGENLEVDVDDDWAMITWPAEFVRGRFGAHAILPPGALASANVSLSSLRVIDGTWHAGVPRYFGTIGDHWSVMGAWQGKGLIDRNGEVVDVCCVRELDFEATLAASHASLLVGPEGPVYYEWGRKDDAQKRAAVEELMLLPAETSVWLVDWHR